MDRSRRRGMRVVLTAIGVAACPAVMAADLSSIDLAHQFHTRSPWRLTVSRGADIPDPIMGYGELVAGPVTVCISNDRGHSCRPNLRGALRIPGDDDLYAEPHYLNTAEVVHPSAGLSLLVVQLASLHSVNGNQRVATQVLAYERAHDRFVPIYGHQTGRNNNEEVRYVAAGRLRGAIIAAEPTADAPFGYWVTVNMLAAASTYRQILHYRSATRYGDGNSLAVIDSEMPNIERRLGLWRAGMPLPQVGCATPHLKRMELWCGKLSENGTH